MLGLVWRRLLSDGDLQLASLEPLQGSAGDASVAQFTSGGLTVTSLQAGDITGCWIDYK